MQNGYSVIAPEHEHKVCIPHSIWGSEASSFFTSPAFPLAMERAIRARLAVAIDLMRGLDGDDLAAVSRTQSQAIIAMVAKDPTICKMSVGALADLQAEALQGKWTPMDKTKLINSLSPPLAVESKGPAGWDERRAMQQWSPHLLSYLTDDEWSVLTSAASDSAKVDVVLQRMLLLSARTLDEHSVKLVASLTLFCCRTDAVQASPEDKVAWMKAVKGQYKKMRRTWQKPASHVTVLPPSTDEFRATYPELFKAAYGDSAPVPARVPHTDKSGARRSPT